VTIRSDQRGPGLHVGDGVTVGEDVVFGAHVTVHDRTRIGPGCVIEDGVVLGKRPRLARHSASRGRPLDGLELGCRVTVCSGAIVFAGAVIGDDAIVGDQAFVRERTRVGRASVVGRGSVLDNDVVVGDRVRIQTNVYITAYSRIEDDVFVGPGACTTNDDTMSRHGPDYSLRGAILRRACRIGGAAVLVPGVEIGEEAFVAAGAVVTRNVPARAVVVGVPARVVREVSDADLLEQWR
jgi:acetyltransferase-like isoleucine patch superfamily enzyme